MSFCTGCGSEYAPGAKFCASCGAPIGVATGAEFPAAATVAVSTSPASEDPGSAAAVAPEAATPAPRAAAARPREFPAAAKSKRIVAALIDLGIAVGFMLLLLSLPSGLRLFVRRGLIFRILSFTPGLYMLLRDSIGGHSIGKLVVGLVVYDVAQGRRAGLVESVVRNWSLALGGIPFVGWAIAGVSALLMGVQILLGRKQRFMDGSASTQVIEERWLTGA
jgi:hypothetical protein